jgi:predicted Zn-dependent protease
MPVSRALNATALPRLHRRVIAAVCALSLLAPAALAPVAAQNALPALGDTDSAEFTLGMEKKLGDEIMRAIHADPDYIDDPLLLEYLVTIWQPLVVASRSLGNITADIDQRFAWQPFLVRDPSVNAFALPGGYVGVHLGLMAITATRDELASVLAHEMSHVSQRHIARSISGDSKRSLVGLAALVLGMLAAARSNSPDAMSGHGEHPGGDDPGPAQLLARGRARGRSGRLPVMTSARLRPAAWRRCSRRWRRRRA